MSWEQLNALADAQDAVRAETALQLAQAMNASNDSDAWIKAQEKLIAKINR